MEDTNANSAAQKLDGPTFDIILKLRHEAMIMEQKISQLQERVNVLEDFHGKDPKHFVSIAISTDHQYRSFKLRACYPTAFGPLLNLTIGGSNEGVQRTSQFGGGAPLRNPRSTTVDLTVLGEKLVFTCTILMFGK